MADFATALLHISKIIDDAVYLKEGGIRKIAEERDIPLSKFSHMIKSAKQGKLSILRYLELQEILGVSIISIHVPHNWAVQLTFEGEALRS